MPGEDFPHLRLLTFKEGRARLHGGGQKDARVITNEENRAGHGTRLLAALSRVSLQARAVEGARTNQGLPPVPGGTSFLLEVPENDDALLDYLTHALGLELVAEFPQGFVLVANRDTDQNKLKELVNKFIAAQRGGASAAQILNIYDAQTSDARVERILDSALLKSWPFPEKGVLTLDASIQTAGNFSEYEESEPKQRTHETDESFARRRAEWERALYRLREKWARQQRQRHEELLTFLEPYAPVLLETAEGQRAVLPDSFTVRLQMLGKGFNDLVSHYPFIFELTQAQGARLRPVDGTRPAAAGDFQLLPPAVDAPAVCVIDSGIMEAHRFLRGAMRGSAGNDSRCFVPGRPDDDVADCVSNGGHGTRVAGAVLYPGGVPATGRAPAVCWLQNARVLVANAAGGGEIPANVRHAELLQAAVLHFRQGHRQTRLFNHSIGQNYRCGLRRMPETAAMLDHLSYLHDVLFIQSAGNIESNTGTPNNPSIVDHLTAGRQYPAYLLRKSSRIGSPAQSLHALTVGSIALDEFRGASRHSLAQKHQASAFTRTGLGLWDSIKPDVVELGGDYVTDTGQPPALTTENVTSPELVCSQPNPGTARDGVGTSYAAPKVAHLAAQLQSRFPDESVQLYRALIAQSARWPAWAERETQAGANRLEILRRIGHGLPDLGRATTNTPYRITLRTEGSPRLGAREAAVYAVDLPQEIRQVGDDYLLRLEVTLAYTAEPRRTRSSRRGYLAVWLDWISMNRGELLEDFIERAIRTGPDSVRAQGTAIPWHLGLQKDQNLIRGTTRNLGTLQKDWATLYSYDLPETLAIAVQGHPGWADGDSSAKANYALVVSLEAIHRDLPIYVPIESAVRVRQRT